VLLNSTVGAESWTKVIDFPFYNVLANTSWGLYAGEFDTRAQATSSNGIFNSKDLGANWILIGLTNRGVTDIATSRNSLYASTYYSVGGSTGLFVSDPLSPSWTHIGPSVSTSTVAYSQNTIYLGTYSHGLWISKDNGASFSQKIGSGLFGPKIHTIEAQGDLILAGSIGKNYISNDAGATWAEIAQLSGKQIKHFLITPMYLYAGSFDTGGLYRSPDKGMTWAKLDSFGNLPVEGLAVHNNVIHAGKQDLVTLKRSIYKSLDYGNTWENTGLDLANTSGRILSIFPFFAQQPFLFALAGNLGIYKMEIPQKQLEKYQFLNIPWETNSQSDLVDKITSFFDHQYPLLGYGYKREPTEENDTTLTYLGFKAAEPEAYYSSHSGIDFGLGYDTQIKAPASGIAKYYFCNDCGYSIKIDHLNGYQTTYMHLQKGSLIALAGDFPVFVGDVIGKVGLSGKTSGPHLHFEVTKDADSNSNFNNDYPNGRVDPFGWQDNQSADTWDGYFWLDNLGEHVGEKSLYLWNNAPGSLSKVVTPTEAAQPIVIENKTFLINGTGELPYNLIYQPFGQPRLFPSQNNLTYLPNTSFLLEFMDTTGAKTTELKQDLTINIDFSSQTLTNVDLESLKLYFYDTLDKIWQPLDTIVDMATKTLSANTSHLSRFAVFGEKIDTAPPQTQLEIDAQEINGWYTTPINMVLSSNAPDLDKIFFSQDAAATWEEYTVPIQYNKNGIFTLLYRSSDTNGLYENANEKVLKLNINTAWTKQLEVTGTTFVTQ